MCLSTAVGRNRRSQSPAYKGCTLIQGHRHRKSHLRYLRAHPDANIRVAHQCMCSNTRQAALETLVAGAAPMEEALEVVPTVAGRVEEATAVGEEVVPGEAVVEVEKAGMAEAKEAKAVKVAVGARAVEMAAMAEQTALAEHSESTNIFLVSSR